MGCLILNGPVAPAASPRAAGGREAPRGRFGIDGYKSIEAKRALMSATVSGHRARMTSDFFF